MQERPSRRHWLDLLEEMEQMVHLSAWCQRQTGSTWYHWSGDSGVERAKPHGAPGTTVVLIVVSRGQSLTGSTWYHWSVDSGVERAKPHS
eukprot:Em0019g1138a